MNETSKEYDAHLEDYQKVAYIKNREEYDQLYKRSIEDPEGFWAEQAKAYLPSSQVHQAGLVAKVVHCIKDEFPVPKCL